MKNLAAFLTLALLLALAGDAVAQEPSPCRIWSERDQAWLQADALTERLARADVIFVGEIHDHDAAHRLELMILEGLAGHPRGLAVGLEMFERDVQALLDGYVAGKVEEKAFLEGARPWKRYDTDYRPLVEVARSKGFPVLATNVPRSMAAAVAREGPGALGSNPPHTRRLFARRTSAPLDAYYERFATRSGDHPGGTPEALLRYYQAQCLKDDTMAETVADFLESAAPKAPVVVHFNGAFHSDYGLGTASRTRQRMPAAEVVVVSLVPVESLEEAAPKEERGRGEFVIFYEGTTD